MVGDDAVAGLLRPVRIHAGGFGRRANEGAHEVDVVVGMHALEDRCYALEAHARVDGGAGQGDALAAVHLLILHEDEVPEFQKPVAILIRAAGRAALQGRALVVEDFRAGAAGAGLAHGPEIVGRRDADDAVVAEARDLLPKIKGLVVRVVDGDEQAVLVEREFLADQLPGEFNRLGLEIIAEGEVAEHLEEGVVTRGVADIVEIVVLAPGAHAFLGACRAAVGAFLDAGEDILELHHARIGEHQCGIIAGHKGRGLDDRVPRVGEIFKKYRPDFVDAAHVTNRSCSAASRRPCPSSREFPIDPGPLRHLRQDVMLTQGKSPDLSIRAVLTAGREAVE